MLEKDTKKIRQHIMMKLRNIYARATGKDNKICVYEKLLQSFVGHRFETESVQVVNEIENQIR